MKHTVEEIRLSNGARGLLIDVPDATVMNFEFQFRAGNRFTRSKDIYETAHIMEHMAFGANAKYKDEHEFEAEFTKNGAYHNAFTSDVSMVYAAECADFEWERILQLQELSICSPRFNETELKAEKGNVNSELTGYLDSHLHLLWIKIQQLLGEDILTMSERLKTIPNITLDDIEEHYKRTHTSNNMRFAIAGRMHGRKSAIKRYMEGWNLPKGERFSVPVDKLHSAKPTLIKRKESSNIKFGWSMILPKVLSDEEYVAMSHLNHILTGTMHSYIFGTARKRGLAYGMFSTTAKYPYFSSWDFGGEVNHETAAQVFDIMYDQLKKVLSGDVKKSDLEMAKSYMLGRYQMNAQTVGMILSYYTGYYFPADKVYKYDDIPERIKKVKFSDMIEVARQFIDADTWSLAMVGSGEHAKPADLAKIIQPLYKKEL